MWLGFWIAHFGLPLLSWGTVTFVIGLILLVAWNNGELERIWDE